MTFVYPVVVVWQLSGVRDPNQHLWDSLGLFLIVASWLQQPQPSHLHTTVYNARWEGTENIKGLTAGMPSLFAKVRKHFPKTSQGTFRCKYVFNIFRFDNDNLKKGDRGVL